MNWPRSSRLKAVLLSAGKFPGREVCGSGRRVGTDGFPAVERGRAWLCLKRACVVSQKSGGRMTGEESEVKAERGTDT